MENEEKMSWNFFKNFKLLFNYWKNKDKYIKKQRKYLPDLIYPNNKPIDKPYNGKFLTLERFLDFIKVADEYKDFLPEKMQKDQELAFGGKSVREKLPQYKNKVHFDEFAIHYGSEQYDIMFHNPKDKEFKFYKPKYLSMFNTFYPQNYFVAYLPDINEIELRQHNTNTDDIPYDDLINISQPIYDTKIIQEIEENCEAFLEFAKYVISKEKEKAREKLFSSTDVLQRAKVLYDLLKIPQKGQEEIYKKITDEDDILNFGMLDADYILWDDIHWGEIDMLFNRDFFKYYGVEKVFEKHKIKYPDEIGVHHSYFILEIGHEILKYGKTLVNFKNSVYNTDKYVIIDSQDRNKMLEVVEGLKATDEIEGVVFYDEIGQIYPLPEDDFFEQIEYVFKPLINRTIDNVRTDLITANEYLLGECVTDTIDKTMPIFTDIIVECDFVDKAYKIAEKIDLPLPKEGFNFTNLCFLLEQKIAKLTGFTDDVFLIHSFELGYDNQPIFILKLSSKKFENRTALRAYKDLISIITKTENQQNILSSEIDKLFKRETDKYEILYHIKSFAEDNNIPFIIHLDWKSPIEELDDYLDVFLKNYYPNTRLKLPTAKDFDEEDGVGTEGVFGKYDKALRKAGLQFGFFDIQNDDYLIIVHEMTDQEKITKIFNTIGWGYLSSEDIE